MNHLNPPGNYNCPHCTWTIIKGVGGLGWYIREQHIQASHPEKLDKENQP